MYSKLHKKRMGHVMNTIQPVKDFINSLGNPISSGSSNTVFENPSCTDTVIKMGIDILLHAKVFKDNEEFCPVVYKVVNCGNVNENYIIIEKLDYEKAKNDFINLFKNANATPCNFNDMKSYPVANNFIDERHLPMFERIKDISLSIKMSDISSSNFGYDKNGKLKALDL